MPFRSYGRGFIRRLLELLHLASLVLAVWLLLQFYSVAELKTFALDFWHGWRGLFARELGQIWDPFGAGILLFLILAFVLKRLLPGRRRGGGHGSGDSDWGDGGDGGDGGD